MAGRSVGLRMGIRSRVAWCSVPPGSPTMPPALIAAALASLQEDQRVKDTNQSLEQGRLYPDQVFGARHSGLMTDGRHSGTADAQIGDHVGATGSPMQDMYTTKALRGGNIATPPSRALCPPSSSGRRPKIHRIAQVAEVAHRLAKVVPRAVACDKSSPKYEIS
ncbi:hypothetical protein DFJ74DRAFT_210490 [Hyaloraphidium curvatum]|nr:hypothetical protein DFJ74DRAFT_210490 [Hyaloraphidium curvatum]